MFNENTLNMPSSYKLNKLSTANPPIAKEELNIGQVRKEFLQLCSSEGFNTWNHQQGEGAEPPPPLLLPLITGIKN